jgi:poly-gamma-glutamate capsule biosynthesis protein CapA/YwtB (metallophosphatase superfamily)
MKHLLVYVVILALVYIWGSSLYSRRVASRVADVSVVQNISIPTISIPSLTPSIEPFMPALTLPTIFSTDHEWTDRLSNEKKVTILATGDVIPARSINMGSLKRNNFHWPFEKTADILKNADLTVINLETPLLEHCSPTESGMIFCGDTRAVLGLEYAGVDVATLANNHIGNYGVAGIEETKKVLLDHHIVPVAGELVTQEIKGTTFAFLAYNDIGAPESGVPWAYPATIQADVQRAKEIADIVIVSFHWGTEYTSTPSARQVELAHSTINAGADVILGNHPHWIQPIELYNNKFIMYAHGNFIFDQEWSSETKRGVIGRYIFYDKKLADVQYVPIQIHDYGQAYVPDEFHSKQILENLQKISIQLNDQLTK